MKKIIFSVFMLVLPLASRAQAENETLFRQSGKIYVVVTILSIIFIGIVAYLAMLDRKIRKIEKERREVK